MKKVKDTILSTGQKLTSIREDFARIDIRKKEHRDIRWRGMREIQGEYY